jgi:hypothetical protein
MIFENMRGIADVMRHAGTIMFGFEMSVAEFNRNAQVLPSSCIAACLSSFWSWYHTNKAPIAAKTPFMDTSVECTVSTVRYCSQAQTSHYL